MSKYKYVVISVVLWGCISFLYVRNTRNSLCSQGYGKKRAFSFACGGGYYFFRPKTPFVLEEKAG